MPQLIFAGRKWLVSSDDIPLLLLCPTILRFFAVAACVLILSLSDIVASYNINNINSSEYLYPGFPIIFLYLSFAIQLFILLNDTMLIKTSLIGTIADNSTRSAKISIFIRFRLALCVVQFCCVVVAASGIGFVFDYKGKSLILLGLLIVQFVYHCFDVFGMILLYWFSFEHVEKNNGGGANSKNSLKSATAQALEIDSTTNDDGNEFNGDTHTDAELEVDLWKDRCGRCTKALNRYTCNLFGGTRVAEDLEAVARILTEVFHHDGLIDIVLSDIMAGFVIVSHLQDFVRSQSENKVDNNILNNNNNNNNNDNFLKERDTFVLKIEDYEADDVESGSTSISDNSTPPSSSYQSPGSWTPVPASDLYRYVIYASSTYSCLLRLYTEPCSSCCRYAAYSCCGVGRVLRTHSDSMQHHNHQIPSSSSDQSLTNVNSNTSLLETSTVADRKSPASTIDMIGAVVGDGCFGTHSFAIEDLTKDLNTTIVYANFLNDTSIKPYAVFFDTKRNEMVISIRGTLSLEDCITDANAKPVEFSKEVCERWKFNGAGRWAHEGMLKAAVKVMSDIEDRQLFKLVEILSSKSAKGGPYSVVVTGHSLGAGIASIMTLFLRHAHPSVKCFCYGPPGCVLDLGSATELEGCVTSVILGSDLVPRASFHSLIRLKMHTLDAISRAKSSKMAIFKSSFRKGGEISDFVYAVDAEPDCEFNRKLKKFKVVQANRLKMAHAVRKTMHIPGTLVYLEKFKKPSSGCFSPCTTDRYFKISNQRARKEFYDIKIDSTMAWDHLPDRYIGELKILAESQQ